MITRVWHDRKSFGEDFLPGGECLEGGGDEAGRVRCRPGAVGVVVRRVHRHAAAGALPDPLQHLAALADLDELVRDAGLAKASPKFQSKCESSLKFGQNLLTWPLRLLSSPARNISGSGSRLSEPPIGSSDAICRSSTNTEACQDILSSKLSSWNFVRKVVHRLLESMSLKKGPRRNHTCRSSSACTSTSSCASRLMTSSSVTTPTCEVGAGRGSSSNAQYLLMPWVKYSSHGGHACPRHSRS